MSAAEGASLDESPDAVVAVAGDGTILEWNRPAGQAFGWEERAGPKGLAELLTGFVHPEDVSAAREACLRALESGGPLERAIRLRRHDGTYAWTIVRADPQRDAGGAITRWLGTCTEIEALRDRAEMQRARCQAAERELETLSYSISHDLRAPLRTIDGFSKIVLEEYGPALPEEGRDYLHAVRRGAQTMAKLIDDLLAFSRIGRQPLRPQNLDMDEIVRSALESVWAEYPGRQEDAVVHPLPAAVGDALLVRQAWIHLLSNAYKFTSRRAQPRIEVGALAAEAGPVYFVRDNGAGYDPRYAKKLFTAFQRLHGANEFPGSGVGLATVQRIVHRHHGSVRAEGALDEGAAFFFTLGPGEELFRSESP